MLTRIILRKNQPIYFIRYLSDKIGDADNKNINDVERTAESTANPKPTEKKSAANAVKIQELLKSMLEANKEKRETNNIPLVTAPGIFKKKSNANDTISRKEQIEEKVTAAVSEVAATLGGDTKRTEAELLSRVLGDVTQSPTNLSDLVLGMKIDRTKEAEDGFTVKTRGQQVRKIVAKTKMTPPRTDRRPQSEERRPQTGFVAPVTIDVFSGSPLGILKPTQSPNYGPRLDTWEALKQRELTLATAQPPRNYFEKMIQWTEQGKVWKFPIDNDQGLEEEAKVHFSEHVFVDSHLEGWCPERGPIRHFMELVCVGLSKNPFYTAQEKKDHIMWFKDYFESKKDSYTEVEPQAPAASSQQFKDA